MLSLRENKSRYFGKILHTLQLRNTSSFPLSPKFLPKFETVNIHYNAHLNNGFITTPNNSINSSISSMFQGRSNIQVK